MCPYHWKNTKKLIEICVPWFWFSGCGWFSFDHGPPQMIADHGWTACSEAEVIWSYFLFVHISSLFLLLNIDSSTAESLSGINGINPTGNASDLRQANSVEAQLLANVVGKAGPGDPQGDHVGSCSSALVGNRCMLGAQRNVHWDTKIPSCWAL